MQERSLIKDTKGDVYRLVDEFANFASFPVHVITAGLQSAGVDFYIDTVAKGDSNIYISREHLTPHNLKPV